MWRVYPVRGEFSKIHREYYTSQCCVAKLVLTPQYRCPDLGSKALFHHIRVLPGLQHETFLGSPSDPLPTPQLKLGLLLLLASCLELPPLPGKGFLCKLNMCARLRRH